MVIIPVFNKTSSRYTLIIELDKLSFQLSFYWNVRENFWYMDIYDNAQALVVSGIKLVVGYSLLDQWVSYAIPPGRMQVLNLANDESIPLGFDNFGQQYQLVYFTAAEVASGIVVES